MYDDPDLRDVHNDLEMLLGLFGSEPEHTDDSSSWYPTEGFRSTAKGDLERVKRAGSELVANLRAIAEAGQSAETNSAQAVQALAALGTLDALVNDVASAGGAASAVSATTATGQSAPFAGFVGRLKAQLGKIKASVLAFLAKHTTLQSWSIAGQISGGLPGLSGSATLTLTFGP